MEQNYKKILKQYNNEKKIIKESIAKSNKSLLIFLYTMLVVLVVQVGILLATNENVIKPEENQYLELRTVEVREVDGQNKQVIMELWSNNLEFKGFDIYFSYDPTKLQTSIIETNEITENEKEYFQFEEEFKNVLDMFTVPTGKRGEIRGVVTFNPPVEETEHIIEKAGKGKVIDSQGSVLLGRMSFQMTTEEFDISWFKTVQEPAITLNTGVKISQDGKKYYEDVTTLRFTDHKVAPNEVKTIEVGQLPQTEYRYGDILNVENGTIIITRNNGQKEELEMKTSMIQGYNPNQLGDQILTITYEGKTVTYVIKVEDYIKDIQIVKPSKLIYSIGEEKDLSGGTVKAIMASGVEAETVEMADQSVKVEGFETKTKGAKLIEVTYEGITRGFGITVVEETQNVKIKELPTKTEYLYGEEIDVSGGTLEVINEEGEKEEIEITKDMITGYDPEKIGNQTITIKYEELEIEYVVNVEDYEIGLKIEEPTKTEYEYGEEIDLSKGTVAVIMASGEIKDKVELMNYMISGYEKEKEGEQNIEVEYKGLKGNFNITLVDKIKGISIYKEPNKTQYKYGEDIDITGATIRVIKSSGAIIVPVTKDMITGYNPKICGTQIVTIRYEGYTAEIVVYVEKEADKDNQGTNNNENNSTIGNGQSTTQEPTNNQTQTGGATNEENKNDVQQNNENKEEQDTINQETQQPTKDSMQQEKPTETLGEQERKDKNSKAERIISIIVATLGIGLILIFIISNNNVRIYILKEEKYKLVGKEKISKIYPVIDIDKYLDRKIDKDEIKIELKKSISKKLNRKRIEITYKNQTIKKAIHYENELVKIYLK